MTSNAITPRIHILDDDPDDAEHRPPRTPRARRGIDYAELVRNARERGERAALREALRAHGQRLRSGAAHMDTGATAQGDSVAQEPAPAGPDPDDVSADEDAQGEHDDDDLDIEAGAASPDAREAARARRIDAQTQPFVAALGAEQLRVVELMRFVAAHVADFCSDQAVIENGNWTIRLKLDAALLPECMLELHLSYFELVLRFDAHSPSTRQLICRHVHVLREQLVNLMHRLAIARHVSIEVP
ncbi:type III secretion system protein SctP [Trinickia caryophylli]|uniref:Type III secretion control protein HpaP n=1 Tax=Trinickia caryophylli TaxID=28094 RepID=A0A1X7ED40_TRICW|nr:type III secretion system protein SctP [Trinickia caryophylli]PMS12891.1 hypothetical protein C0Z17_06185 [Trinickia caryophylli]TRX14643.1 hypothetical protein FNF07_25690 [Trinickia caryophylli]WQE14488.1 type III secretion system protein SctP [Trinickia caryophylli]SMF31857.1 type III secretion control protein HpaP [Trinickia caryophylli]GLU32108.1 type III secretion protein [Trinickia caryophylli]